VNILRKLALAVFVAALVVAIQAAPAKAYSNENMIDNAVFDAKDAMNEAEIRAFLQSRPNTCLTRVGAGLGGGNIFDEPMDYFSYGPSKVDAARVIYKAAQYNGINPRVILATLQKEQGMITDTDCYSDAPSLNKAMGYACYEGASECPASWAAGFERQVMKGAWQLAFDRQRAEGNTSWGGNDSINYGGRMTEGNRKRCGNCALIYYDGYSVIDGVNTRMGNGATASLYNYTPHRNQSFPYWFELFFGTGSTSSDYCSVGGPNSLTSDVYFRKFDKGIDYADLVVYSGTRTNCIETHTWNPGMQSWRNHVSTNQQAVSYPDVQLMYGDLDGTGLDYPFLLGVAGTSTGRVESHVWRRDMRAWLVHAASNQPVINPSDCKIVVADLDGNQKEEPTLVCLRNTTTGKIEIHTWGPGMQSWRDHIATNMPTVDPTQATVVAGDIDGNGADELILVAYNRTGSAKVEFHVWNSGQQSWWYHIATNMPEINPFQANVQFADIDGNKVDEAILVALANTGSGKIEFHTWNPGYYSWRSHISSNQPTLN
jgi:hypothetical protein